jgi:hypothetical protein
MKSTCLLCGVVEVRGGQQQPGVVNIFVVVGGCPGSVVGGYVVGGSVVGGSVVGGSVVGGSVVGGSVDGGGQQPDVVDGVVVGGGQQQLGVVVGVVVVGGQQQLGVVVVGGQQQLGVVVGVVVVPSVTISVAVADRGGSRRVPVTVYAWALVAVQLAPLQAPPLSMVKSVWAVRSISLPFWSTPIAL